MKRNKLYEWNYPTFALNVDRVNNNIYDGSASSYLNNWNANLWGEAQSKNAFGLSKINNPFSRGNMAQGLGAMANTGIGSGLISAAGSAIGSLGNKLISDGYSNGVGSAVGSIGSTVGGIVGQFNPVLGGIISAGSGLLGGLTNRAFGTKVNEEALREANAGTEALRGFTSNAQSFDEITNPMAVGDIGTVYKGGWFNKGSARRKNAALQEARDSALLFANNSVANNLNNLQNNQIANLWANYSAFGGPLFSNNSFRDGGGIHIKPSHRGLFTAKANNAGMGVQQYASHVLANEENYPESTLKQARFAKYIGGRKHDDGGALKAAFLDNFSSNPLGAVLQYNQGLEALAAQREAQAEAAAQQKAFEDMQNKMLTLETQNQGLQSMYDEQSSYLDALSKAQQLQQQQLEEAQAAQALMTAPEAGEATTAFSTNSSASLKPLGNNVTQTAMNYFLSKGLSTEQAAGLVGNLWRESNLNPNAINPNGGAYGIAQWLGKRKKDLFARYGKNPTLEQQLDYVWHELNTTHKKGLNRIMASKNADEAAKNAFGWYEFSVGPEGAVAAMNKAKQDGARSLNQGVDFANRIYNTHTGRSKQSQNMGKSNKRVKAFGGELGTNGTDFTNGLLEINTGGMHEENPYQGVQIGLDQNGVPNLVEEGETIFNNYVFSKRMQVPPFMRKQLGLGGSTKSNLSFADASKKIAEASRERPNSPMDEEYLFTSLGKLADIQETERMRMQAEEKNAQMELANALPMDMVSPYQMPVDVPQEMPAPQSTQMAAYGGQLGNMFVGKGDEPNTVNRGSVRARLGRGWYDNVIRPFVDFGNYAWDSAYANSTFGGKKIDNSSPSQRLLQGWYDNTIGAAMEFGKSLFSNNSNNGQQDNTQNQQPTQPVRQQSNVQTRQTSGSTETKPVVKKEEVKKPATKDTSSKTGETPKTSADTSKTSDNKKMRYKSASGRWFDTYDEARKDGEAFLAKRNKDNSKQENAQPQRSGGQSTISSGTSKSNMFLNNQETSSTQPSQSPAMPQASSEVNTTTSQPVTQQTPSRRRTAAPQPVVPQAPDRSLALSPEVPVPDATQVPANVLPPVAGTPAESTSFVSPLFPPAENNTNQNYPQGYWGIGKGDKSFWEAAMETGYTGLPAVDEKGNLTGSNPNAPILLPYGATEESVNAQAPMEIPSVLEERMKDPNDPINVSRRRREAQENNSLYPTWMRYVPAVGAGIMTLTDALGLTNKADYTYAKKLEAAADRAGFIPDIQAPYIGDYMTYRPMDRMFYANQLQANARATDRNIMNTAGGNRAQAMAGTIANGYATNNAIGNMNRQEDDANWNRYAQTETFNKDTNKTNAELGLEADIANARFRQMGFNAHADLLAKAAATREAIDQRVGAARTANLTNLLESLGNIGRENFALNQINSDRGWRYKIGANGGTDYKGNFGAFGGEIERYMRNKKQGRRSR